METSLITKGYAFTRNPIFVRDTFDDQTADPVSGGFKVSIGDKDVFEGRFAPPLDINLAEIAEMATPFIREVPADNREPVVCIEDAGELYDRKLNATFWSGNYESSFSCLVFPGGVSKRIYRQLAGLDTDIFREKILNYHGNFILTTRTTGWKIIMKETEVSPLYFIVDKPIVLTIKEKVSSTEYSLELEPGVWCIDIDALRIHFLKEGQVLASVFDVFADDAFCFKLVIEEAEMAKERYRLKFRNSIGVFEIIEIRGELVNNPEFVSPEDRSFKRYDRATDDFIKDRERVGYINKYQIETVYRNKQEMIFLMDMLASDEVYLLDASPYPVKVIPESDSLVMENITTGPQPVKIILEVAETNCNIMEDLNGKYPFRQPKIFTKTFDNRFK